MSVKHEGIVADAQGASTAGRLALAISSRTIGTMRPKQLVSLFHEVGLRAGDVVFVHSSLKAIGPVDGGADAIIDSFLEVLTPEGLLAVPTHTWATVNDKQPVFHQTYSPSTVGVLTNVLRSRRNAFRSLHPTHSVAAIGNRAGEFCAGHERDETPCSPGSPYGRLIDWGGKVVLLGVDLTRCTFFHCLEEVAGLGEIWTIDPVRRRRYLIRHDGTVVEAWAREHIGHMSDNYGRAEGELREAGVMTMHGKDGAAIRIVDAVKARDYLVPRLRANPWMFR